MNKAKQIDWRNAVPAAVVFISGPEEFLAGRALRSIRDQLKAKDPSVEIHEIEAIDYSAGQLLNLTSPSLFAEPRLVIIRGLERSSDDLIVDGLSYLLQPTEDTTVVLRHNSSSVRGKKLVDAIRASGVATEINCLAITKDAERVAFVQAEFSGASRKITVGAVRALLDAFADDIAELASACGQLLLDSADNIT
ncbi:MAG: hypothetical protein RLZZ90_1073, partial [Actinomycetota bacterium]